MQIRWSDISTKFFGFMLAGSLVACMGSNSTSGEGTAGGVGAAPPTQTGGAVGGNLNQAAPYQTSGTNTAEYDPDPDFYISYYYRVVFDPNPNWVVNKGMLFSGRVIKQYEKFSQPLNGKTLRVVDFKNKTTRDFPLKFEEDRSASFSFLFKSSEKISLDDIYHNGIMALWISPMGFIPNASNLENPQACPTENCNIPDWFETWYLESTNPNDDCVPLPENETTDKPSDDANEKPKKILMPGKHYCESSSDSS